MSRPLPKNLRRLYAQIGRDAAGRIHGGHTFTIDGVEFVAGYIPDSTADRFYIVKSQDHIRRYREFLDAHRPRRIFELGIAEGGSTAMHALLPGLERLVAIDNEEHRLEALDEFVSRRGLDGIVRTHYGVDQADRRSIAAIAERDFEEGPIDLVVDDASHEYGPTVASFECLFPRLRPGGWYLVEDWAEHLIMAEGIRRALEDQAPSDGPTSKGAPSSGLLGSGEPLERLAFQALAAVGVRPDVVDQLSVCRDWIALRRGPATLDPRTFRLNDAIAAEAAVGVITAPRASQEPRSRRRRWLRS